MVLGSQISRPNATRRYSGSRRRRRPAMRVVVGLCALVAAYVVWKFWPPGDGETIRPTVVTNPSNDAKPNEASPASPGPAQQAGLIAGSDPVAAANAQLEAQRKRSQDSQASHEALMASLKQLSQANAAPGTTTKEASSTPKTGTAAIADAVKKEIDGGNKSAVGATGAKSEKTETPAKPEKGSEASATLAQAGPATSVVLPAPPQSHSIAVQAARATLTTPGATGATLREGMNLVADGKLVEGRKMLSRVLVGGDTSITAKDAQTIRDTLMSINKSLIFSDRILEGDPLVELYSVASGDLLAIIARRHNVTYPLLEQINNIDAKRIRVGQRIKVIKGPFHVVVSKSSFRMDLFLKDTDGTWVYATSFPVGVGKDDSTPAGAWICRANGKLPNPGWTHPRTNQYFAPDDPKNPIGEYWIGLEGTDETTKGLRGYGIHGTIDRESVGKQASLGCVRMLPEHIEQVYKLLVDGQSTVTIQP